MAGRIMEKKRKLKILYKIHKKLDCSWERLVKLSDEQVNYLNHYIYYSSFLEACPGSGKTEVIGIKAALEIQKWKPQCSGIVVVSFTISAANELNRRIKEFSSTSTTLFPHFVGTFDSWIHNYIFQPFTHYLTGYEGRDGDKSMRVIDVESSAGFLNNYITTIYKENVPIPIKAVDYFYDYSNKLQGRDKITDGLLKGRISKEEASSLLSVKGRFIKDGFATYSDAEWICNILLSRYPILSEKLAKRFPVIFVDECQDLSKGQIKMLDTLKSKGSKLHFVGDINQSIYEFREVIPEEIINYIKKSKFIVRKLTNNYRSCQPIVDVFSKIIGNSEQIIGNEKTILNKSCILWQYTAKNLSELPEKFERFIFKNDLDINKSVILARGKTTLSSLRTQIDVHDFTKVELFALAIHNWFKSERNYDDLNSALFYLGRALCLLAYGGRGDVRNQYCPDSISAVEWRLYLKQFLDSANAVYPFSFNGKDLCWSSWVKVLKPFLESAWQTLSNSKIEWKDVIRKIRVPSLKGDSLVKDICSQITSVNRIRTTTIHNVKGETLSAVLLVSHPNRKSQGGHYSHWIREGNFNPEYLRFAYVACSRPKHALILATPKLNTKDLAKFEKLGFVNQFF